MNYWPGDRIFVKDEDLQESRKGFRKAVSDLKRRFTRSVVKGGKSGYRKASSKRKKSEPKDSESSGEGS